MSDSDQGQNEVETGGEVPQLAPSIPVAADLPPAPPTVAGPLGRPPRRIVWPTAIGIIAIVFGSIGILWSLYNASVPWMMSSWTVYTPGTTTFDPLAAMRHWAPWMSVVHGIGVPVAGMLLAGGIGLLLRRTWSATVLVAWAIVKIPVAVAVTFVSVCVQQEQMSGMAGQPGGAVGVAFINGFAWFFAILTLAWYWALPVFMLIWFAHAVVRQGVESWRILRQGAV
jgi:hypothetical protein